MRWRARRGAQVGWASRPASRSGAALGTIASRSWARGARMEDGTRALAESTRTNLWGVLPVAANGECFVRVLAVQLDDETFFFSISIHSLGCNNL